MKPTLLLAAGYNLVWGGWVILFPRAYFDLIGMAPPSVPQLWQCIGMIVGVYGVGYAIAAFDPFRHWPIVLVGLLGKLLGPLGLLPAVAQGALPLAFGWTNLTNDLVWWIPFSAILWQVYRRPTANPLDGPATSLHSGSG
jgi:hypothetical protein